MIWNDLTIPDKPYFHDKGVVIYWANCMDILPHLPKVDLVLTDIPFNVNHPYASYKDKLTEVEYSNICHEWFATMRDKAKGFIVKAPTKTLPLVLPAFAEELGYLWTIVQHSPNATTHGVFNLSLFTLYLVGGQPSKKPSVDFFSNTNNQIVSNHPAEMPSRPLRRLLEWFTEATAIILDPFMGSGTTLRAAKDLGRKAIGIEVEEKYCRIAAERMQQSVMELGI